MRLCIDCRYACQSKRVKDEPFETNLFPEMIFMRQVLALRVNDVRILQPISLLSFGRPRHVNKPGTNALVGMAATPLTLADPT